MTPREHAEATALRIQNECTNEDGWYGYDDAADVVETAIRAAGAPLAEALRACHAALENEGYQDDPAEAEHPFLSPAMVAARLALAAWEAK
jgi:hypothetical protein